MAEVLFNAMLEVHYGQAYVVPEGSPGFAAEEAFRGQKNGLCGAAVPECLWLITGLHTGGVQFCVELHERAPADLDYWDDVVEVSFSVCGPVHLEQWAAEAVYPLQLPKGLYRARYSANEMDAGHTLDTAEKGPDSYLLQFWPIATQIPDAIIKQTSDQARYWHTAWNKRNR
jgi:hypothetical protein